MRSKIKIIVLLLLAAVAALGFLFLHKWPAAAIGQATLSWSQEPDEATIQGYRIYYGTTRRNADCPPGGYGQSIDVGKKFVYTVNNLEAGKTYYFSVTFYTLSGQESCFSQELEKTVTVTAWERLKDFFGRK